MSTKTFPYLTLLFSAILIIGCQGEKQENEKALEVTENTILLRVPKEDFGDSNKSMDSIRLIPLPAVISASGMIEVPPNSRATVNSYMGGYVKDFPLLVGDRVEKGQRLLTLENLEFLNLQQEYLEAEQRMIFLESEYERQQELFEEKINSEKVYLRAKSDFEQIRIVHQGLRQRLLALQMNPDLLNHENMSSTIRISAPISGSISKVHVNSGSYVDPSDPIMEIINATHLHLEIQIFEKDAIRIKEGQTIRFRVPEYSEQTYSARVHLIGKTIDQDRTVQVHAHLDEEEREDFIPGMFIQAEIMAENLLKPALPEGAFTEIDDRHFVFELIDENETDYVFRKIEVSKGRTKEGFSEVDLPATGDQNRYLIGY